MLRLRDTDMPRRDSTSKILNSFKLRPESQEGPRKTIYSLPIRKPRAGDTYWVESKYVAKVGHLPYNAAIRNELMQADQRLRRAARVPLDRQGLDLLGVVGLVGQVGGIGRVGRGRGRARGERADGHDAQERRTMSLMDPSSAAGRAGLQ